MSIVTVDVVRLVDGAALGAVRIDINGRPTILLHDGLPLDEQTALLDELTRPGERLVFVNNSFPVEVPAQRSAVDDSAAAVGLG